MNYPLRHPPAEIAAPNDPDILLPTADAAGLLSVSERTLESFRLRGGGPPFILIGRRAVRYRRGDLLAWIDSRRRVSTSDPGQP